MTHEGPGTAGHDSTQPGAASQPGATGPDAHSAQQPGQPYGGQQPGQPYGAQPGQPQGAQPGQPYGGQQPGQPYGAPQAGQQPAQPGQPYGAQQPGQPYGGQPGQPYGAPQPGQPYGGQQPYGAQQPGQPYGAPGGAASLNSTLMWAHLLNIVGILGSLIFWLVMREKGPAFDREGKEATNWGITVTIAAIAAGVVSMIPFIWWVGSLALTAVWIVNLVFAIMGGVQTNQQGTYQYPFSLRLIK